MDEKTGSPSLLAMGFMCGTSLDGIDGSLIRIKRGEINLLAFGHAPFSDHFKRWFRNWMEGREEMKEPSRFMPDLADLLAQTEEALGQSLLSKAGKEAGSLSAIGTHGVTIRHQPSPHFLDVLPEKPQIRGVSYQFSNPFFLSRTFRVPVVSQFRGADIAAGGCGAPLAPILHRALFSGKGPVAFLNIGGIANVTSLPPLGADQPVIAFDTGPGNMLLDSAVHTLTHGKEFCDMDGKRARRGRILDHVLARLLSDPFFSLPPPKSTGREDWGREKLRSILRELEPEGIDPVLRLDDLLATLTELTAAGIDSGLGFLTGSPYRPAHIIIGGGGVNNSFLLERIGARTGLPISSSGAFGIPPQAIESMAFAYLAILSVSGRSGAIQSVTGARDPVILGQITPPPGRTLSTFLKDVEDRADTHLPSPDRPRIFS